MWGIRKISIHNFTTVWREGDHEKNGGSPPLYWPEFRLDVRMILPSGEQMKTITGEYLEDEGMVSK